MVLSTEVALNKELPLLDPSNPQNFVGASAIYTIDGITWQRVELRPQTSPPPRVTDKYINVVYRTDVPVPTWPLPNFAAFYEFKDQASNVKVSTPRAAPFHQVFLPVARVGATPDLVGSISISPDKRAFAAGEHVQINVTITNTGNGDAGPFWVDLFINPSSPPTTTNVSWNTRCALDPCFGIAWRVPGLQAHDSVTLTSNSFPPGYSIWPGWFAAGTTDLYLYVDSWNPGVATGGVVEGSESNNAAHLGGLTVSGPNPPFVSILSATQLPERPAP
jgi:hypothetical protein